MDKIPSFPRALSSSLFPAARLSWKAVGLAALAITCTCFSGCATSGKAGTSYADNNTSAALPGPSYYQSDENPFHAD